MRIDVVTLFPEELRQAVSFGVVGKAIEAGLVELHCWNPRDDADDARGTVDDRPFGGGPGMVMLAEPLMRTLDRIGHRPVTHLSPQGQRFDQALAKQAAGRDRLVLLCGRYEGIDERLIQARVDEEWSLGDFVISGGELAAAVVIDAVTRLQPGALGKDESAEQDSFADGLLDCPHYTRPESWMGEAVPEVLRSGNHEAIRIWRLKQALGRTWIRRPEMLEQRELSDEEAKLLEEFKDEWSAAKSRD